MIGKIVSIISSPTCIVCGNQATLFCKSCWQAQTEVRRPACFLCNMLTIDGKTCKSCKNKTKVAGATIPYRLQNFVLSSIYQLKYNFNSDMAQTLAQNIVEFLPENNFTNIMYVPSVGKSQRKRGYNQSKLIAKHVSKYIQVPVSQKLHRTKHTDLIGQNRLQRFESVKDNFILTKPCKNDFILLIDDVVTTGATVSECSKVLKAGGAKKIWVLAVAKK